MQLKGLSGRGPGCFSERALAVVLGAVCVSSVLFTWVGLCGRASADQTTGTWTGEIAAHGNYYLEKSTRIVMPTGRVTLEAPNGVRMGVSYLADVIASASVAQTGKPDSDAVHIELRQGPGAFVGKTFAVGENELDVSANVTHSWESDYISWMYGARGAYSFNQKNTSVSLSVTGVQDTIYMNQPSGERMHFGDLNGVTTSLGFTQILSPVLTFAAGYQLVYLSGFLGNAYRAPKIGPLRYAENPPDTRIRHNVEAFLAWYLPATGTTLQAYGRAYTDSWELQALTPELRVYQAIGPDFSLRLRLRYYTQTKTYFASDTLGEYPAGWQGPVTADPKLSAFHSIQTGARVSYALRAFGGSILDFVSRGSLDLSFDHQWTTVPSASYGRQNLFIILGGRLPF